MIGPSSLIHRRVTVLEDLHNLRLGLGSRSDFVPKLSRSNLDRGLLGIVDQGQLQLSSDVKPDMIAANQKQKTSDFNIWLKHTLGGDKR